MTSLTNNKLRKYLAATLSIIMTASFSACGNLAEDEDLSKVEKTNSSESIMESTDSSEDSSENNDSSSSRSDSSSSTESKPATTTAMTTSIVTVTNKDGKVVSKFSVDSKGNIIKDQNKTTTTKKSTDSSKKTTTTSSNNNNKKTTTTKSVSSGTSGGNNNTGGNSGGNTQQTYTYYVYDEPQTQAPQTQAVQQTDPPQTTTQKPATTQKPQTTTTQAPQTTEDPKPQTSWVDNLSSLERAYYNFGTNKNFTDSDWSLIYNDLCARAMSFDGKKDVHISQGYYVSGKDIHLPGALHITIDTDYYCTHEVGSNGAPTDYYGGFLPGTHAGSDVINSYEDLLWWIEDCRAVVDLSIRDFVGDYSSDFEDDWYVKNGYDVHLNPGWAYNGNGSRDYNWLIVLY